MSRENVHDLAGSGLGDSTVRARQARMALLARASTAALEQALERFDAKPEYNVLRAPETGMVMVRARAGGTGGQFNMGEMSVTRCVVQSAAGHMGYGYVAGRDKRHAILAAVFDALMQDPAQSDVLNAEVLAPIQRSLDEKRGDTASKVAATRVDFFTLVRGDD